VRREAPLGAPAARASAARALFGGLLGTPSRVRGRVGVGVRAHAPAARQRALLACACADFRGD
jgi:hypothetical protein